MTDKHSLIAFLTVIAAIVALVVIGAFMSAQGHSAEALGIGGAVTGLIGIAGTFKPRSTPLQGQEPLMLDNPLP